MAMNNRLEDSTKYMCRLSFLVVKVGFLGHLHIYRCDLFEFVFTGNVMTLNVDDGTHLY